MMIMALLIISIEWSHNPFYHERTMTIRVIICNNWFIGQYFSQFNQFIAEPMYINWIILFLSASASEDPITEISVKNVGLNVQNISWKTVQCQPLMHLYVIERSGQHTVGPIKILGTSCESYFICVYEHNERMPSSKSTWYFHHERILHSIIQSRVVEIHVFNKRKCRT